MTTENRPKDAEEQAREDLTEGDILRDRLVHREGIAAIGELKKVTTKEEIRLQQIGDKYLAGMPYERERVIAEVRLYLHQTVTGIIEAGKRLIAMKEAEKHGDWLSAIEERLGVSQPTAWRFMAIARKFENIHAVNKLHATFTNGVGKLYALLSVPDEELAEFDETGLFKGATPEAIDKMSVSQFRKLIAEKEDWKAKAKQLELDQTTKYDSLGRTKKGNEELKKKIAKLERDLADARKGLPEDAARAIDVIEIQRSVALGVYGMLSTADPEGADPMIAPALVNLAWFLKDLFTIAAYETSSRWDVERPYPENIVEQAKEMMIARYPEATEGIFTK